ncbi:protein PF14_0175-like isoform X2 [Teleopsis dalmanni]|uniref:protein PF14_0175-like isoform X2 n=1 Tax=Teleopsis dalmanni TaxID=139649 RepID=UPI0018CF2922|nr:protein PF14_0175-like isoform X2 [Teleopsis dalmanni]
MGNDLMENTTENIFSSQIGDVDEREEGEIVDDFEYIISSDEALTVRKRIAELESKNDEIEKIDLISRSFANGFDCGSISEIIAKFRTPSNEYYHHFPRSQLNRSTNLIRSSSSESEMGSFSLNRKEDRKRRKFPTKNSINIRSTYYKSNNHQQFRKDINSKRYVPNKKRRHNFDYKKCSSHIDAHEDSTDDCLVQTDNSKCRKEVKSQESSYSKNHDHYKKKKPLKNHIKHINGFTNEYQNYLQNNLKDSKEISKSKELVENLPENLPPEEKIEIPNASEEVKLCNNINDKSDSQEEEELRLIALKSAMIQRHLKRKRRNAELAYSPTDFDEMLASVEADNNSNLVFEVDLDESITEMEISPTTSPRFSPIPIDEDLSDRSVEFVAQSNAIDTKPVDMDIVNTESESENVVYSVSNKMFAIDPVASSSDCKITDLGPSISYNGMDYASSLQYRLYVPDMQYQLNIPPPPLPPVLNDCMEVIPPPPLFCSYNELPPPPPPPILIPLERQNDEISDETEIIDLCNDTVEENIITKDITEIKSEDTSCIYENQQNKENSEGEEEEALRALLLSKIQSGRIIKKENDICKTESTVNPELKIKNFNNIFKNDESPQAQTQTQSILKEAVRRLKMITEGNDEGGVKSEIIDKSDKSDKDNISLVKEENEMEKDLCLKKFKERSPNKNSALDHLLEERIAELVRQEKATEVSTSVTVSDVSIAKVAGKLDTITVSCVNIGEEIGKLATEEKNLTTELNLKNKTNVSDIKSSSSFSREQSKSKSDDKINVRIEKTKNIEIKNNATSVIAGNKEIYNAKKNEDSLKFINKSVAPNLILTPKINGIKQISINKNLLSSFDNQLKSTANPTFPITAKQPSTSIINNIQKSNSASTFISTVRKIIKPNKIINTNMNLKRKTVENNPNTKFKLTKMSNAIDRSVNTSPFGSTTSTTSKTSRLVTPSEIPKPVVQKIIINLQTSESDIEDEEEDNLTNMKQLSSFDINTNYIDNASPLSLPMDSRSNTPIRVSSPTILTEKPMINTSTIKVRNDIFEQKLENFLKNIRDKSKTNMKDNHAATMNHRRIVNNDKAVRHLPIAAQHEYSRLVERMKLLEKQRENKLKESNESNGQKIQSKNIDNKTKPKITLPKNKTIATPNITNPNSKTIDISKQNKTFSTKQNMMYTEKDGKHNSSPIKDTTAVCKNKSIDSTNRVENIASNHTATTPTPSTTKANTAMILSQESKRRVTLRLQENSYNKSSAIILNKLDSSLKLVSNVKAYKIAEVKYEKRVKELVAQLEEAKLNLKKQKEKLEEICPEVSRSNEVLTNMRKRRLKLFRVATNLGKSIVGENYSLNNELNKEIKIKFNDLAREIKVVNSISHKNIDAFETNLTTYDINQHLSSKNDEKLNEPPKHLSTENVEKLNEPITLMKLYLNESNEKEKFIEREKEKFKNNEGLTTKHEEPSISRNNNQIEKNIECTTDIFNSMELANPANNNIEINTNSLMYSNNTDIEKNTNNVTDVNKTKEYLYIELAKPEYNNIEINTNSLMDAYNADIEKKTNNVTDVNKNIEHLYIELAKPENNNSKINANSLLNTINTNDFIACPSSENYNVEISNENVIAVNKSNDSLPTESNESVLNDSKNDPMPQTQISEEDVHLSIINTVEDLNAPDNGFDEITIKEISNNDNEARSGCFQQYASPLMNSDKIERIVPEIIFCPYELMGSCADLECKFNHFNEQT